MTGKMTTLARPYALAAFEIALKNQTLDAWQSFLDAASLMTQDSSIQQLLSSPKVTTEQLFTFYGDVLGKLLNPEMTNFIHLLAEYERLAVLPDIAILFKAYCAEQEKKLHVQVTSAMPLTETYKKQLIDALTKRLQRNVILDCQLDPDLLGGAVITAGDSVIDGSVRGKLDRMTKFISESL